MLKIKDSEIHLGDSVEILKTLPDNSIDSIVTDPPSATSFMCSWDNDKGGRKQWVEWLANIMKEGLRVVKPGSHILVWALPRTSHWTSTAIEDTGFEIKDIICHHFAQGMPKGINIGKHLPEYTGWNSLMKPAAEFWILARKPLSEPTIIENVKKWSTGGLNIDATKLDSGRFTTNVLFTHHEDCKKIGTKHIQSGVAVNENRDNEKLKNVYGDYNKMQGENKGYGLEKIETWECVDGCPIKLINQQSGTLKSGTGAIKKSSSKGYRASCYGTESRKDGTECIFYGDEGGASRFFTCFEPFIYKAKASKSDKGNFNNHPTVKSIALMTWLLKLITPPQGTVLDMFMGSGSTGVAALQNDFKFIGIEKDANYFDICIRRLS